MSSKSNSLIDVYFYVDPETKVIDGVFSFHPLGISIRAEDDWQFVRRANTELDRFLVTHEAYLLDWDTDYLALEDTEDDEPLEEHKAIRMYDGGELTIENLTDYARLVNAPKNAR
jgi:hypothetical protein